MPSKIIPNKYEKLTYYILNNYNTHLRCEGCNTTEAMDGTVFIRDQAETKDNMYYHQFRCKGKGKGKCSQSYTHEDFLALAIRQLGQQCVDRAKVESGFTSTPGIETPVLKHRHNGYSTEFTSSYKRT